MKTNTLSKLIFVFLGAMIFFTLNAAVYAETGTNRNSKKEQTTANPSKSGTASPDFSGQTAKRGRSDKYRGEWFEDWFDDRIDSREHSVDYSRLPGYPTDEEMLEFFRMYFLGENTAPETVSSFGKSGKTSGKSRDCGNMKPERRSKEEDRKADMFEDWFEDRIEARKHQVDFSQLPENPTDEEILEFFKNNFLNKSDAGKGSVNPNQAPVNTENTVQDDQQVPAEEPAQEETPAEEPATEEISAEETAPEAPAEESAPEKIPSEEPAEEGKETA